MSYITLRNTTLWIVFWGGSIVLLVGLGIIFLGMIKEFLEIYGEGIITIGLVLIFFFACVLLSSFSVSAFLVLIHRDGDEE